MGKHADVGGNRSRAAGLPHGKQATLWPAALLWALLAAQAWAVRDHVQGLRQPQGLALDPDSGYWYWAEAGARKIRRADPDFLTIEDVLQTESDEEAPFDLALDAEEGKVYWTSAARSIKRANLNGTGEESLVGMTGGGGIALDTAEGKMYWTSRTNGTLWRANLNGSAVEELVNSSGIELLALALDRRDRKVYWADMTAGHVSRADLNGSGVQGVNFSWANLQTSGMAIDSARGKIYLTDHDEDFREVSVRSAPSRTGRILRAGLDGSNSEVLIAQNGMENPFAVALNAAASAVFWTDRKLGKIQSLTLYCSAGSLLVASKLNHSTVQVPHGAMSHGHMVVTPCPDGYDGSLRTSCNDGMVYISSGQCAQSCAAGEYEQAPGVAAAHGAIHDGEVVTETCIHGMVGAAQLSCSDGVVSIVSRTCRVPSNCVASPLSLGHAIMTSPAMQHGDATNVSCPVGFFGEYALECVDGEIDVMSGSCLPTCDAGSIWVDDGAVSVSHSAILPGYSLTVICPEGSAGEGVELSCVSDEVDFINVTGGSCTQNTFCGAGRKAVNGAMVPFTSMDDGGRTTALCPAGFEGSVNLTCSRGVASIVSGYCYADCQAGVIEDNHSVPVLYEASPHSTDFFAECPGGYRGVLPLACHDGNVTLVCAQPEGCACFPVRSKRMSPANDFTLALLILTVLLLLVIIAGICYQYVCKKAKPPPSSAGPSRRGLSLRAPRPRRKASQGSQGSQGGEERADASPNEVVVDVAFVPLPGYWATRDGVHIFPDPNRITEVQQLMSDTWRPCFTRDRMLVGGAHRVPVGCRVANVLRVENHLAYERYCKHKEKVISERRGSLEPFGVLTDNRLCPLDGECNEKFLFHGTHPEAAHAIARDLFRIDMAGARRGSMFGPGIYLAENASKSDEYAKEGGGVYVGLCAMLICRAVTGRVLTVDSACDCSAHVRGGEYDAVCGDRLAAAGTYREMVYFHEEAVYPEFIVIYARVYEGVPT